MRMSRHEKAIRDEIAGIEKEIESGLAQRDDLEAQIQSKIAQKTMLLHLLEKAESAPGEVAPDDPAR